VEILGGPLFGVAGAGESHGPAYTTIVFGCPPGLRLARSDIQCQLDRRRPGGNVHGTPRREVDQVLLLSGLYDEDLEGLLAGPELMVGNDGAPDGQRTRTYEAGLTTGEPIAAVVLSASKRSADYTQFAGSAGEVRPGHADLVKFHQSRGATDPRGGGRASYRATISDVIGGSVARIFLAAHFQTVLLSSVIQVGHLKAVHTLAEEVERMALESTQAAPVPAASLHALEQRLGEAEVPSLDPSFAQAAADLIEEMRAEGDSVGSVVEVVAVNVPPLIGRPLYQSLKVRLMGVLGGLNAAEACEVGDGSAVAARRGSENNDAIRAAGFQSNRHGGLLGGITTGMPLVCRITFKPTASIQKSQLSVRQDLSEITFQLHRGRHDPCVGIRSGVTLESRVAIEVMNAVLMHQAGVLTPQPFTLFGKPAPGW
jgi:chorismate synthase